MARQDTGAETRARVRARAKTRAGAPRPPAAGAIKLNPNSENTAEQNK